MNRPNFSANLSEKREKAFRFANAWEQRKLEEISNYIIAGGDINKEKITTKGKYPVFANALSNDGIVGYYDDYFRVSAPAVTITGRGDVGIARSRNVNFTPVVRLLALSTSHNTDFIANSINLHKIIRESTGVPQLTVPQLQKFHLLIPADINEETKIGCFFSKINVLLTLHQRQSVSRSLPSRCSTLIYPRTLQGLPRRYLANQYPFNQSKRYVKAWNKTDKFIFKCHFFITPKVGSLDGFLLYCQNGCAVLQRY